VLDLLYLSRKYIMPHLTKQCTSYVRAHLSCANALQWLVWAHEQVGARAAGLCSPLGPAWACSGLQGPVVSSLLMQPMKHTQGASSPLAASCLRPACSQQAGCAAPQVFEDLEHAALDYARQHFVRIRSAYPEALAALTHKPELLLEIMREAALEIRGGPAGGGGGGGGGNGGTSGQEGAAAPAGRHGGSRPLRRGSDSLSRGTS
jgi:hypothetical protein